MGSCWDDDLWYAQCAQRRLHDIIAKELNIDLLYLNGLLNPLWFWEV